MHPCYLYDNPRLRRKAEGKRKWGYGEREGKGLKRDMGKGKQRKKENEGGIKGQGSVGV